MTIHFVKDADVAVTPARERLAFLLQAKADAAAEVREVQARIARLTELAKVADPIRARLAGLESAEATRFAEWAKGDPGVPVPAAEDSTARTDLLRELSDAQSRADAATRAVAGMSHETADAHAKSVAADKALPMAAAVVALEELAPIVEAARIAVAKISEMRMKGRTILNELLAVSLAPDVTPEGRAEFGPAYGAASAALTDAFAVPHDDLAAYDVFRGEVLSCSRGCAPTRARNWTPPPLPSPNRPILTRLRGIRPQSCPSLTRRAPRPCGTSAVHGGGTDMPTDNRTGLYRAHASEPDAAYIASVSPSGMRPNGSDIKLGTPGARADAAYVKSVSGDGRASDALAKAADAIAKFSAAVDALDDIAKRIDKLALLDAEAAGVAP